MDVPQEDRAKIRARRDALEWSQEYLAAKIGVSNGTISNLETGGKTGNDQCYKRVYAEVVRVLKVGKELDPNADRFRLTVEKLLELDERGWSTVESMLDVQLSVLRKAT